VFELNINGQPDENVFAVAKKQDRILLTHDEDFLDDRQFPQALNPGVVILPGADGNEHGLLSSLFRMLSVVGNLRELWRFSKILIAIDGTWTVTAFKKSEGRHTRARYRFSPHRVEIWVERSVGRLES
jgi:hypothetical protein